jgi:hypothetical protein
MTIINDILQSRTLVVKLEKENSSSFKQGCAVTIEIRNVR